MAEKRRITAPIDNEVVESLRSGDEVLINGTILTGRDAAHKRLVEAIEKTGESPVDLNGQIIYYVGPAPAKPGYVIGSAGPTTSVRMDAYSPYLMEKAGLKGMIGKGNRGNDVIEAMKKYKGVYMVAIGGAAALISKSIKKAEILLYEDLGPEAIRKLEVEDFPAVVINDSYGGDLSRDGIEKYRR
jgi:fumarate hydratase subunit beta